MKRRQTKIKNKKKNGERKKEKKEKKQKIGEIQRKIKQ